MLSARRRTAWFMVTLALLVVAGLTGSGAWIGTATLSGESLSAPGEVRYQVGILLDGSGSIRDSDFRLMREAFAAVIGNQSVVPRDGSVEITVVQIGVLGIADQVRVEITTTQVTEATVGPIVARLRGLQQGRGMTPTAAGIRRCVSLMRSSPGSATAVRRVINIATDGKPNDPDPDTSARDSLANAIAAAQEAQAAGIDELDAELLGLWSSADLADFQAVIFPQPAEVFTSGQPITAPGFVQIVEDYRDVEAALRHKMRWSVSPPTATPTATATATRPATVGPLVVPLVMQRAGLLTATPTSTPTVSPTATPTATPWSGPMQECLTQVWCDDFSDPNSGWPDSRSEDATIGYVLSRPPDRRAAADGLPGGGEGEYRILIEDWRRGIAAAYPRAEDYAVETRARFESVVFGSLGICFGITKSLDHYAFLVDQDGRYSLWIERGWSPWPLAATSEALVNWTSSPHVNPAPTPNHLRVVRRGSAIELYANGYHLDSIDDDTFRGCLHMGVVARSTWWPLVDARFDDYCVFPILSDDLSDAARE